MVAYLKHSGCRHHHRGAREEIASPDVKGTYDGLVIPRKLPGPDNRVVEAKPAYDAAIKTARPALQALYRETFAKNKLDAIAFPTMPKVAIAAEPNSRSLANFLLFIQNTDPGSNAGIPGIQIPVALGTSTKLPVGIEMEVPRAATAACSRSGWRWKKCSAGFPRRRAGYQVRVKKAVNALPTGWRRRCGGGRRAWRRWA